MFQFASKSNAALLFAAGMSLALSACDSSTSSDSSQSTASSSSNTSISSSAQVSAKTIVDLVVADTNFSTLKTAVIAAGLDGTLADRNQQFTVFAPTNAAFALLPAGVLEQLLKDPKGQLKDILLQHVVAGKVQAADVIKLNSAKTLFGADFGIEIANGGVLIDGKIKVTATDLQAVNGVVHVIDAVILPSITDIVVAKPQFSTLKTAVVAAKLDGVLAAPGAYTVLAPTNDAFAKLPAGTVDTLLKDPTGQLSDILKYHVAPTVAYAKDVVGLSTIPTLLTGATITVNASSGVKLNGSTSVVATDIYANNGVVHAIDNVLLPPAK